MRIFKNLTTSQWALFNLEHFNGRSSIWSTSGGTLNWVVLHFNPEGWIAAFNEKPIIHLITCRYGMKEYLVPAFSPGAAQKWKRKSNSFTKGVGRNGRASASSLITACSEVSLSLDFSLSLRCYALKKDD